MVKQARPDTIYLIKHDWFRDKDTLAKLSQGHDFLILPGVEVNTDDGRSTSSASGILGWVFAKAFCNRGRRSNRTCPCVRVWLVLSSHLPPFHSTSWVFGRPFHLFFGNTNYEVILGIDIMRMIVYPLYSKEGGR